MYIDTLESPVFTSKSIKIKIKWKLLLSYAKLKKHYMG